MQFFCKFLADSIRLTPLDEKSIIQGGMYSRSIDKSIKKSFTFYLVPNIANHTCSDTEKNDNQTDAKGSKNNIVNHAAPPSTQSP